MATPLPLVGVVVLNFNGKDCLSRCLASLQNLKYERFFIVVVDNDSTDGSYEAAKQKFPKCSFLPQNENRGFAAGMNSGIALALARGADWVWIFNNDAWAEENTLSNLMTAATLHPEGGLLSPWIINSQRESLWFGKGHVDWLRMRVVHDRPTKEEQKKDAYPSQFLTGCAMLISKKLITQVGALDERFFLYYEDADLSLRARQAGFSLLVVPSARVFHAEQSQKSPKKLYFLVFSGLLFFQKHAVGWRKWYLFLYTGIRRGKNLLDIMRGRDEALFVRRAYDDFYHGT